MFLWNTTEGGPCLLRPIRNQCWDSADPAHNIKDYCVGDMTTWGPDATPVITSKHCKPPKADGWIDTTDGNNILKGIPYMETFHKIDTPYADVDPTDFENDDDYKFELRRRWHCGWNNQFAFPWEISSYWNFTTR